MRVIFFFSSRRRHTRSLCDWSSDVCSSDLPNLPMGGNTGTPQANKPIQLALAPSPHRNQQLFSDHYLNVILPKREDWQALVIEAEPIMRDLQRILADYTPSDKEVQLEDDLVKPVLRQ